MASLDEPAHILRAELREQNVRSVLDSTESLRTRALFAHDYARIRRNWMRPPYRVFGPHWNAVLLTRSITHDLAILSARTTFENALNTLAPAVEEAIHTGETGPTSVRNPRSLLRAVYRMLQETKQRNQ